MSVRQRSMKTGSVFLPLERMGTVQATMAREQWAGQLRERLIADAAPWSSMSDAELRDLVVGHTLPRSWFVWSAGYCPSCLADMPMYAWVIDATAHPWKVKCPHCLELFPKNDFFAYYRSGLDEDGLFQPERADRRLLRGTLEAEDAGAAIDDGWGYIDESGNCWRFVGYYLVAGQWRELVLGGIRKLAQAYAATGDKAFARRAAVLLERLAERFPAYDFASQGVMYEGEYVREGYVTYSIDSCIEVRELALCYDLVFEGALKDDRRRASRIEQGIFREALGHLVKLDCNAPQTEFTVLLLRVVLEWPVCRNEVYAELWSLLNRITAVDGLTGEKGLAGYAAWSPHTVAEMAGWFLLLDRFFLEEALLQCPTLVNAFRFHLDTWCLGRYYPQIGDVGSFALPIAEYKGAELRIPDCVAPSAYALFWRLFEVTGDPAFAQLMHRANGNRHEGLPYDLLCEEPAAVQASIAELIKRRGADPALGSVLMRDWHVAILRSGAGRDARALWIGFDTGFDHGHLGGLNVGLFAKGLDLLPDFGYPPVQYGSWETTRALWYGSTAAHHTALIDGANHLPDKSGSTVLWSPGSVMQTIRVEGSAMIADAGVRFERTLALIDVSDTDFYVLDVIRLAGGRRHEKYAHGTFGSLAVEGDRFAACEPFGHPELMRGFRARSASELPWTTYWDVEDRYGLEPDRSGIRLNYLEYTEDAAVCSAEGWVSVGDYNSMEEAWIPSLMIRRELSGEAASAGETLCSAFVSLLSPSSDGDPCCIRSSARLRRADEADREPGGVALEIGSSSFEIRDLIVLPDPEAAEQGIAYMDAMNGRIVFDGEALLVRFRGESLERIIMCRGSLLQLPGLNITAIAPAERVEIAFCHGEPQVIAGDEKQLCISWEKEG
ncbi:heparinase II/III domain-containing protein [Paenibacillus silvisoli]|uniref:heparinase II/III domain-containing protein n=1 Tax=Paenibacillus silvisoli TaxID=3110539 RepID=UPI0028057C9D|nr:heparinase II/III family protein [Paenibacillus silvisoli]